ncbi:S1/P1 nuclease [uncultured Duncaniella sp.]|uniref:S1/P1 nuclease n=1 Tax=uncultured Duncaniella sp. TaxID=2768039 RepID=UPI0025E1353C|nr:S1/P1 nuclease [uncultured Duncaniella sp.]
MKTYLFKRLLSSAMSLSVAISAFAWGQKGHDVTAYIAEQHFTPATLAAVTDLLDGMSPVYWANWLDNASHTPEYAYSKTWHYKNVDADKTYWTQPEQPGGDIVQALRMNIGILSDSTKSQDERGLALKMVIHLMGDLHQPMHMGHATDRGGNGVKLRYFGRDANLHGIWDSNLVESAHKWGYTEWQQQLDRLPEETEVVTVGGNLDDWAQKTVAISRQVYAAMPAGTNVSYNEVAEWAPVIEAQLLIGGLRLAHVLNSIYDPAYQHAKDPSTF